MHKVLIITYYWPPAGGPGVQRWLKFVKYLPENGILPLVYVPKNPTYPIVDPSLNKEVPKDLEVYSTNIFEPYNIASFFGKKKARQISSGVIASKDQSTLEKLLLWIRGNLFIPDARKFWIKPSFDYLLPIIKEQQIDTIITTGPPHSIHLIGLALSEHTKIRWIADFRDPWTSISYHKKLRLSKKAKEKHKSLEKQVLQSCDDLIVTSETTKLEFEKLTAKRIHVITNGFDVAVSTLKPEGLDVIFSLSHIGSMLSDRNPLNLWVAISELLHENKAFKDLFKLQLVGVVGEQVLQSLKDYGIMDNTINKGYVSHQEAIEFQRRSQVLLLVEIDSQETQGIIPGKLFEYFAAKRPILGIGPKKWEAGDMIIDSKAGVVFDYLNKQELKELLLNWFNLFLQEKLKVESVDIEKYSRKSLTLKLAQQLLWE